MKEHHVNDISLAKVGKERTEWAANQMPVLSQIREEFKKDKPLKGLRIAACLHCTTETANLLITLKAGGALVSHCAANPLSTQDDVAASLVKNEKIPVFAIRGEDTKTYYAHIDALLERKPDITMDDGADLVTRLHLKRKSFLKYVKAGTEETTTGVLRLKSMERNGILAYPMIAINNARTKYLFDNRYGTGQSTIDGILRATNILLAGRVVVVVGYGWCGRGIALRAQGLGANVIICEVDPLKALEAAMDGFRVMPLRQAAKSGDLFITVTGNTSVIGEEAFRVMKEGAILANSGHFDVEIDVKTLAKMAKRSRPLKEFVKEYTLKNGRRLYLLAEGRVINLSAAEGHPASVMDMSFANQALSVKYLATNASRMANIVYDVPYEIDESVASLKLGSQGIEIDTLTKKQKEYLESYLLGT